MDEHEVSEGFSPKKVVAGAALGVAVPAAVAVAKKLVGGNGGNDDGGDPEEQRDDGAQDEPMSRERKHASRAKPKPKSSSGPKRTSGSSTSRSKSRTREQLYKQATRLKIEGRSSMNKAQLERAVDRAKQKAKAR